MPWCVAGYYLVQLGVRLAISSNLEVDDAEMVGQIGWAWGYPNSHPPLFHWLVRLAHDLSGSWVVATAGLKYLLLAAALLFLYDAGRRLSGSRRFGAVVVAFAFLIPSICSKAEGKLTHSILGFAATAAVLHALVLVLARPRASAFAWLGLALGAGLLAKYNFLLVVGALVVALLCCPEVRGVFRDRRALFALVLPLGMGLPHWLWIWHHPGLSTENLYRLRMTGGPLGLRLPAHSAWDGFVSLLVVVAVSLAPMVAVCFGARLCGRGEGEPPLPPLAERMRRFLGWLLLAELGLFVVAVFAGGLSMVHERYLVVLLPPFPLWLALRVRALERPRVAAAVAWVAAAVAALITVARPIAIVRTENPLAFPYAAMAAEIARESPPPTVLLADRPENAGNIASRLPGEVTIYDGRTDLPALLLIADDPDKLSVLGKTVRPAYAPSGGVRLLAKPWRWNPARNAQLAVQRWRPVAPQK